MSVNILGQKKMQNTSTFIDKAKNVTLLPLYTKPIQHNNKYNGERTKIHFPYLVNFSLI